MDESTGYKRHKTTIGANQMDKERPYNSSLIDRFQGWVQNLPMSTWVFYALFAVTLSAVQLLVIWLEGGLQFGQLLPIVIFNALFSSFLLALMHFLDNQATESLQTMAPVLEMTILERERAQYVLATMPSRESLLSGVTMVVFAILMERLWVTPVRYAALEQLPIFAVVFQIVDKGSAFLFGVFIFHTIRQLRLVTAINRQYVRISLYDLTSLQSFSKLTAATAVGLVAGVYAWLIINPDLLADPLIFAFVGVITVLAVTVFVLPLLGVHRRMESEKDNMLQMLDRDLERAFSQFNRALREEDHATLERLNGIIASLEIQHNKIKAIATWPWKPETAQFTLTAITLPLILAIVQFFIERALDS